MSPFKFKRTHIPTGKSEVRSFDVDYCQFVNKKEVISYDLHKTECMDKIRMWNKMGVVDGSQMWSYELIGTTLEGSGEHTCVPWRGRFGPVGCCVHCGELVK